MSDNIFDDLNQISETQVSDTKAKLAARGGRNKPTTQQSNKNTILILDIAQMCHNSIHTMRKNADDPIECIRFFKHLLMNEVMGKIKLFPGVRQIIFSLEYSSWRKNYFIDDKTGKTLYKANRHTTREKDNFDWNTFWKAYAQFEKELADVFPFVVVKVYGAEGDDNVAILSRYVADKFSDCEVIVLSRDKDFKQLLKHPRIKLFDQYARKYVLCDNPQDTLLCQILCGDAGDGIPNVLSPKNSLVDKITQKKLGEKKAWKAILDNNVASGILNTKAKRKRFDENRTLIDFDYIPDNIKNSIIEEYEKQVLSFSEKTQRKLLDYFIENDFQNLVGRIHELTRFFA